MLFPFTEKAYHAPKLSSEFLPTLLADIDQWFPGFSGYLLLAAENECAYLLFSEGVAVARAARQPGRRRPEALDKRIQAAPTIAGANWAAYLLAGDEGLIPMLYTAFVGAREASFSPEEEAAAHQRLAGRPLAVLERATGDVAELSLWRHGAFVVGYRHHAEVEGFLRVDEARWREDVPRPDRLTVIPAAPFDRAPVNLPDAPDPLGRAVDRYIALFEHLQALLGELWGEKTTAGLAKLVDNLKKRYGALYRGVEIVPETGAINWRRLLQNRDRVDVPYRYDLFCLYLDEILRQLARGATQRADDRQLEEWWRFAGRLLEDPSERRSAAARHLAQQIAKLREETRRVG